MVIYGLIYFLWILVMLATHISLCIVVYKDAVKLQKSELGISPILWLGVTFVVPIFGMFIYWIMNHSTLTRNGKSDYLVS